MFMLYLEDFMLYGGLYTIRKTLVKPNVPMGTDHGHG